MDRSPLPNGHGASNLAPVEEAEEGAGDGVVAFKIRIRRLRRKRWPPIRMRLLRKRWQDQDEVPAKKVAPATKAKDHHEVPAKKVAPSHTKAKDHHEVPAKKVADEVAPMAEEEDLKEEATGSKGPPVMITKAKHEEIEALKAAWDEKAAMLKSSHID